MGNKITNQSIKMPIILPSKNFINSRIIILGLSLLLISFQGIAEDFCVIYDEFDPDIELCLKMCPSAKLISQNKYIQSNFSYTTSNLIYDTPQYFTEINSDPSDGFLAVEIDKIFVGDESEDEWWYEKFDLDSHAMWAVFSARITPLYFAQYCDQFPESNNKGVNIRKLCWQRAFFNWDMGGGKIYQDKPRAKEMYQRNVHVGGPFLSDTNKCEFGQVETWGLQIVDYDQLILWDWDDFNFYGIQADAIEIEIFEGDQGFLDDTLFLAKIDKENSDGMTELELAKNKIIFLNAWNADTDEDGVKDIDELAKGTKPAVNEAALLNSVVIPMLLD